MRGAALVLLLALLASPLAAVKLKLKAEEKEVETTVNALNGDEVSFTRARKDSIAHIDDFEPASAFLIKKQFTPAQARPTLELARFASHRALFAQSRDTAVAALRLDASLKAEVDGLVLVADVLEAEQMVEAALNHIEAGKSTDARTVLTSVREKFSHTPSAIKAEVLVGSLDGVELAARARQLEEEARKAQDAADAEEGRKRKPVDDWLASLEEQIKAAEAKKVEADTDCQQGKLVQGLPKYESTVNTGVKLRKAIEENRKLLKWKGQPEHADRLDERAKKVMIDCYERWATHLYRLQRYEYAADLCARGIALDPADRRLLALKVDIDEMWDPTEK